MNYAGIIKNDLAAAPGVCLSFFVQGCSRHCPGCHNPEAQDFYGGKEFTKDTINEVIQGIKANGILRPLCIMGGEPFDNIFITLLVIEQVKNVYPDLPIYVWSGYTLEELLDKKDPKVKRILKEIDYLIDGPYIEAERDITLSMRGSRNQRVLELKEYNFND